MKRIAIQGIKGSFHHQVAHQYFGQEIQLHECLTFKEIPSLLKKQQVDAAVIAIENSIAGSLLPNYKLIDEHELQIVGEVFLPIHHQLLALKGQTIHDLTAVHSHPMALQQCEAFFEQYPHITLVESKDTAESAMQIAYNQHYTIGAIASTMAGNLYELATIAPNIHTYQNNTTRFFVVQLASESFVQKPTKASLKLTLAHRVGSLLEVLQLFTSHQLNLTKIQSLPLKHTPFQYAFFIDVEMEDYDQYQDCLAEIAQRVSEVKILGEYLRSEQGRGMSDEG